MLWFYLDDYRNKRIAGSGGYIDSNLISRVNGNALSCQVEKEVLESYDQKVWK